MFLPCATCIHAWINGTRMNFKCKSTENLFREPRLRHESNELSRIFRVISLVVRDNSYLTNNYKPRRSIETLSLRNYKFYRHTRTHIHITILSIDSLSNLDIIFPSSKCQTVYWLNYNSRGNIAALFCNEVWISCCAKYWETLLAPKCNQIARWILTNSFHSVSPNRYLR